ncbi:bifunctional helix-turn-helix domain-containing protein/methylated-DNA--[protein]-cysteine S-methyltransferase [Wenyingzhuangia sp. IMCC45574]
MKAQHKIDYTRIEKAITYLQENRSEQPSLDKVAAYVGLSPYHFQRMFTDWAGVSPKKFLEFTSLQYAKSLLGKGEHTLFDVAEETGLSGTGRLHDLFVKIEGMSPGIYKNKGQGLDILYFYYETLFGLVLVACTNLGVCYLGFVDDKEKAFMDLKSRFIKASFIEMEHDFHSTILQIFSKDWTNLKAIKLHLKGTDFQLKVWEALLKIPTGELTTYGDLAKNIDKPKASRAVGTAIGSNPIAFLIPCHRVIQSSGVLGGYMWGIHKKSALLGWEAANKYLLHKNNS